MKKGKKKYTRTKKEIFMRGFEVKQERLSKILSGCIILLIFLVAIYSFTSKIRSEKEEQLGGELGTLKWDLNKTEVVFQVLEYALSNNNQTLDLTFERVSGGRNIYGVFFVVNRSHGECNLTIYDTPENLPEIGESVTIRFEVNASLGNATSCQPTNFTNITEILVYAQIDLLVQETTIPDLTFYKDDSRDNLLYLAKYFTALSEINYSIVESPENNYINVVVNNLTKNLSISVLDSTWFGTQEFDLTAVSDGDEITTSFSINILNETRPVSNDEPEFDDDECESFTWYKNTNKTIDMDTCWDDEEDDDLELDYGDLNDYEENISIIELSGNRLKLVPQSGFNGSTYLYFYADDSYNEASHKVYLYILGNTSSSSSTTTTTTTTTIPTKTLKIVSSNPSSSQVSFFINESKKFSIVAESYENIEWYLDNTLVKEGVLVYTLEEETLGSHLIKVRIINGTAIETKTWEVSVISTKGTSGGISGGEGIGGIFFYLIILTLSIMILIVVWMLVLEIKKTKKRKPFGFGVSVIPNRNGPNESSKQFNIPRD
ncbi:MAG: hypothetical protein WCX73_03660 [Candidatus Pacearchaeota archaeon]|jgi:hypothetical protein